MMFGEAHGTGMFGTFVGRVQLLSVLPVVLCKAVGGGGRRGRGKVGGAQGVHALKPLERLYEPDRIYVCGLILGGSCPLGCNLPC